MHAVERVAEFEEQKNQTIFKDLNYIQSLII